MVEIQLIGTIHYELKGAERLRKALEIEKPEILTVEASQQWIDCLEKNWKQDSEMGLKAIKDRGVSKESYSFFEDYTRSISNYEIDVCRDYSNQTRTPLYLIDSPEMVNLLRQELLSQFRVILNNTDPRIFEGISRGSIIESHDKIYAYVQELYDGKIPSIIGEEKILDLFRGNLIGKRDETQARNIEELAKNNDVKIVHVGGCFHNLTDSKKETLYSKLERLNPSRKTLWSYDP